VNCECATQLTSHAEKWFDGVKVQSLIRDRHLEFWGADPPHHPLDGGCIGEFKLSVLHESKYIRYIDVMMAYL